jgi:hypothetical protein
MLEVAFGVGPGRLELSPEEVREGIASFYYAPESGHLSALDGRNYFEYAPLIKSTTEWRRSYRRVSGPLVRLARSAILSSALCQPCSASFMAFSVAALASAILGERCAAPPYA